VPYKGASQVVTALLAGEVQFYLAGAGVGAAHVKAGKLRALAVASKARLEALPEVPTFSEAGLGGINASNWWGVAVPAGTPKAVVERLHASFCKALAEPATRAAMVQMGNVAVCNSAADMQRQLAEESAMWQRTLPTLGVKAD
jgi:tripartite-type tricarboxylate transporter receptor subunit TctC